MALLESVGALLQSGITLAAMLVVLLPYGWWLPIALLVSTLPAFFIVLQHRLRLHRWLVKNTPDERRAWYYDWLLTVREAAAELRLFQLSDHFQEAFQSLRRRLRGERIQLMRAQSRAELAAGSLALLVTGLAMVWMIGQALHGLVTLGDLALFYSAFNQGQGLMRSFMENVGEMYSHSFFLSDLFEFLGLQPRIADPAQPVSVPRALRKGIRFEHVTFSYPESTRKTLQDFNLDIAAGQVAAIVGANGAGKSTLIKLLCRFYDPQEGTITIDGTNLRDFSVQDLRRQMTVLFQEPVHYSATVRENIALGDVQAAPSLDQVLAAAEAAGADKPIGYLADGYDTLLGKWFEGGADLSVGEWQRLALARAFLRQAPVIVLDEPTSAMDPWGEADWLGRFRQLAGGRTAILITHRFTTAAFADCIYVMDEGRIVEAGSHHELLSGSGRYAASWKEQMQRWMRAV
jgi:ATP-binding cassette subfamily B protein